MQVALVLGVALLLMLARVPVAFALLVPCVGYVVVDPGLSMSIVIQRLVGGVNSFALLAVPMFILAGNFANAIGLTDKLFGWASVVVGHLKGGLGYVNILVSLVFSWMSGAAIADAAVLGRVAVPQMIKRGYDPGGSIGITGASSMIAPIMPPSIPAVIYGVTSGVSIGSLFMAGVVPALLLTVLLVLFWFIFARGMGPGDRRASTRDIARRTISVLPAAAAPIIVLGGILAGVFTATEAAACVVIYILFMGVCYRTLSFERVRGALAATARTTASVLIIVAVISLFGLIVVREQVPQTLAAEIARLSTSTWVFLLLVNLFLLVLGMFFEPLSGLLIVTPILLPVAIEFGVDPVHFGIMMILNLLLGLFTPPIGLLLFVLSSVTDVPLVKVIKGCLPFMVPVVACLLMVTYIPDITLAVPRHFGMVP